MPANSEAGENGNGGLNWYLPAMIRVSKKLSAAALMATRTSPGPATGSGRSASSSSSGPQKWVHRMAFMIRGQISEVRDRRDRGVDQSSMVGLCHPTAV